MDEEEADKEEKIVDEEHVSVLLGEPEEVLDGMQIDEVDDDEEDIGNHGKDEEDEEPQKGNPIEITRIEPWPESHICLIEGRNVFPTYMAFVKVITKFFDCFSVCVFFLQITTIDVFIKRIIMRHEACKV